MTECKFKVQDIKSLDDMADLFFQIAKRVGHPLVSINLTLSEAWGKQRGNNETEIIITSSNTKVKQ